MSVSKAPLPQLVAVVGSRDFKNLDLVRAFVRSLPEGACVVSGGARGVDQAAEDEAVACDLTLESYRPFKDTEGKWRIKRLRVIGNDFTEKSRPLMTYPSFPAAAHARNTIIVRRCVEETGAVVAFWDGSSPGTKSVIQKADSAGVLYAVYTEAATEESL